MRSVVFLLGSVLLVGLGCGGKAKAPQPPAPLSTPAQTNEVRVRPLDKLSGRVVAVNDNLRFVVLDFPDGKLPRMDQRLSVYRLNLKVGELKITGPYRGTTVAADLTAGDARFGDLVRD